MYSLLKTSELFFLCSYFSGFVCYYKDESFHPSLCVLYVFGNI